MAYAVVRVRGIVNVQQDIAYTMKLLRLNRVNHCVIIPETTYYKGMLQKVKDYVTWGKVSEDVLIELIKGHGKVIGGEPITDKFLKSKTKFATIKKLSKAVTDEVVNYKDIPEIIPILRLHPPKKGGYEGIKRSFVAGGALGFRDEEMDALLRRMIQ